MAGKGKQFQKGPDPRRKINPRKGMGVPFEFRRALMDLDEEAVETIKRVMKSKTNAAALAAAKEVMERNHGKVPQPIEGDVNLNNRGTVTYRVELADTDPTQEIIVKGPPDAGSDGTPSKDS